MVALSVDSAALIVFVAKVELVALADHKQVELMTLLLHGQPAGLFLWSIKLRVGFFLDTGQKLRVQAIFHTVLDIQHIKADIAVVVPLLRIKLS